MVMDVPAPFAQTVLLFTRDGLGYADTPLQHALASKYLGLLLAGDLVPAALCFYTEGVHLVAEGSPLLEMLAELERRGARLLVCTTCVEYFGLKGRIRVGTMCGMPDILDAQLRAARVVTV
jgi:hypothetical protein